MGMDFRPGFWSVSYTHLLQSEYRKAQREEREYDTLRQNVEALLEKPRESEPQRQRNHELE